MAGPRGAFYKSGGDTCACTARPAEALQVGRDADECMADMSMCHPLAITVEGATGLTVAEAPERERSSHGCWRLKQLGW